MIIKVENLPKIGDNVVDQNLRPVGTVFDVFGPVSSPYVAVKPQVEEPHNLVDQTLYSVPPHQQKRKKRR